MSFFPYGPLEIGRGDNGLVAGDREALSAFWDSIDDVCGTAVSGAVGCYVFSVRAGKGVLPWYVGMAEKQGFRKECFTSHKLNHYNQAIAGRKGTPVLTLVAKHTDGGRLAKPSGNGHKDIQFLENMLIGACIRRNPGLMNIRATKLLREMVVPGMLNNPKGRDHISVVEFRKLIGM